MRWLFLLLLVPLANGQLFEATDPAGDQVGPFGAELDYTHVTIYEDEVQVTFSERNDETRGMSLSVYPDPSLQVRCFLGAGPMGTGGEGCEFSPDGRVNYFPAPMFWNGSTLHISVQPPATRDVTEVTLFANGAIRVPGPLVGFNGGLPPADEDRWTTDFVWNGSVASVNPIAPKEPEPHDESKQAPAPILLTVLALGIVSRRRH